MFKNIKMFQHLKKYTGGLAYKNLHMDTYKNLHLDTYKNLHNFMKKIGHL